MKASELREKSTPELNELLETLQDRKFRLRLQHYMGQLEHVTSMKTTRREIGDARRYGLPPPPGSASATPA